MKTFEYFKKTGEIFTENGWDGDEGYWITYEVDKEDLQDALVDILFYEMLDKDDVKEIGRVGRVIVKDAIRKSIDLCDGWEVLFDEYEEELKDEFELEALGD